jgi:brefeldin A-inhibited guanine nucleotide-exchange protein
VTLFIFSNLHIGETFEGPNPHDNVPETDPDVPERQLDEKDLFIKDAFLVFRALCKLTMKPLNTERSEYLSSIPSVIEPLCFF